MYDNYHSNYILYPVIEEQKTIQTIKNYDYGDIIQKAINIIKKHQIIMLKVTLNKNTLLLTLLYDAASIDEEIIKEVWQRIDNILRYKKNIILTNYNIKCNYERFNMLRGFN